MAAPFVPPAPWVRAVSRSTQRAYFSHPPTNTSVWEDPSLPYGWAVAFISGPKDKWFMELATMKLQRDAPMVSLKRSRPEGAAENDNEPVAPTSPAKRTRQEEVIVAEGSSSSEGLSQLKLKQGDSPLLAIVRQAYLTELHRMLALGVAAQWPLPGDSKTMRACREEGLLPGLQGMHARLLLALQKDQAAATAALAAAAADTTTATPGTATEGAAAPSAPPSTAEAGAGGDALIPCAPAGHLEKDTKKELVAAGMPEPAAEELTRKLCDATRAASLACGALKAQLLGEGAAAASSPLVLPVGGRVYMAPLPTSDKGKASTAPLADNDRLVLLFVADEEAEKKWLIPAIEKARALNKDALSSTTSSSSSSFRFGRLNEPLFDALSSGPVKAAIAALGLQTAGRSSAALVLNASHYRKAAMLYRLRAAGTVKAEGLSWAAGDPACEEVGMPLTATSGQRASQAFLARLFCLLARYETYCGNAGGLQGAVCHHVFDALERICGVGAECFASPFNCHFPRFCSAFPDTDASFGSLGSFFSDDFAPLEGAFEANPPFVNGIMLAMARKLDALLGAAEAAGSSLLFYVIVPAWEDAYFYKLLAGSKHCVVRSKALRKDHEFIDGLQHRAERTTWGANVDSGWFVLASPAAAKAYKPAQLQTQIEQALRQSSDAAEGGKSRFFKYQLPR